MSAKQVIRTLALALAASAVLFTTTPVYSQDASDARKVKSQVTPAYPDLAKRMNVHGHVKLEVVITPDGHVKSIRTLGGHPLLASAAQTAVQQWRFEAGPKETTQVVEFNFD